MIPSPFLSPMAAIALPNMSELAKGRPFLLSIMVSFMTRGAPCASRSSKSMCIPPSSTDLDALADTSPVSWPGAPTARSTTPLLSRSPTGMTLSPNLSLSLRDKMEEVAVLIGYDALSV